MEKKKGRPASNRTTMNVRIDNALVQRVKADGASNTINKALWDYYTKNV